MDAPKLPERPVQGEKTGRKRFHDSLFLFNFMVHINFKRSLLVFSFQKLPEKTFS